MQHHAYVDRAQTADGAMWLLHCAHNRGKGLPISRSVEHVSLKCWIYHRTTVSQLPGPVALCFLHKQTLLKKTCPSINIACRNNVHHGYTVSVCNNIATRICLYEQTSVPGGRLNTCLYRSPAVAGAERSLILSFWSSGLGGHFRWRAASGRPSSAAAWGRGRGSLSGLCAGVGPGPGGCCLGSAPPASHWSALVGLDGGRGKVCVCELPNTNYLKTDECPILGEQSGSVFYFLWYQAFGKAHIDLLTFLITP